jgi:exopolysaccharide biosynthesis polyprenyl glycosylphosphotransferase
MTLLRRRIFISAAKLFDLAVVTLCFGLAALPAVHQNATVSLADFLSMQVKVRNFALFALFLLVWHIIFSFCRLYNSRRLSPRWQEALDLVKATTLGAGLLGLAAFLFRLEMVTPRFAVGFWSISSVTLISSRLVGRHLLSRLRVRGRNLRQMLIVGTNPRAVHFARKIAATPALGYSLLGFVDRAWAGGGEFRKSGYPLVSDFERFPAFLRERVVDEVVIVLPMKSMYSEAARITAICEEQGIVVRVLANFFNLKLARSRAEEFEHESVITLGSNSIAGWQHLSKRFLDFSASLVSIIILTPLFLVIALLIKLTSSGPVFFIQERVGLNKRRFRLFKFRTMVQGAEQRLAEVAHLNEVSGPVFKIKNDPRLTRAGKFLRKTSIDELPQLLNVLKGDMSLVGPRPLPLRDYEGFDQDWQRRRFSVRPGITCLWQINGRSSTPFEKWMELDMLYIDHWSLGLDLKILAKTLPAVLRGVGAH